MKIILWLRKTRCSKVRRNRRKMKQGRLTVKMWVRLHSHRILNGRTTGRVVLPAETSCIFRQKKEHLKKEHGPWDYRLEIRAEHPQKSVPALMLICLVWICFLFPTVWWRYLTIRHWFLKMECLICVRQNKWSTLSTINQFPSDCPSVKDWPKDSLSKRDWLTHCFLRMRNWRGKISR